MHRWIGYGGSIVPQTQHVRMCRYYVAAAAFAVGNFTDAAVALTSIIDDNNDAVKNAAVGVRKCTCHVHSCFLSPFLRGVYVNYGSQQ
jgi:hypothetical protein